MSHINTIETAVDILEILHEKLSKLLSGGDTKAIQKIVISLGHICMKETSTSHLNIALNLIFSLCRSKVGMKNCYLVIVQCASWFLQFLVQWSKSLARCCLWFRCHICLMSAVLGWTGWGYPVCCWGGVIIYMGWCACDSWYHSQNKLYFTFHDFKLSYGRLELIMVKIWL